MKNILAVFAMTCGLFSHQGWAQEDIKKIQFSMIDSEGSLYNGKFGYGISGTFAIRFKKKLKFREGTHQPAIADGKRCELAVDSHEYLDAGETIEVGNRYHLIRAYDDHSYMEFRFYNGHNSPENIWIRCTKKEMMAGFHDYKIKLGELEAEFKHTIEFFRNK